MPKKPKRPCAYPGCPELTEQTYCEKHRTLARQQYDKYERAPDVKKKYGREWKRIRDKYMSTHPFCECCYKSGRMTVATECHHIIPISKGGQSTTNNLMALCKSCHTRIHCKLGDR